MRGEDEIEMYENDKAQDLYKRNKRNCVYFLILAANLMDF